MRPDIGPQQVAKLQPRAERDLALPDPFQDAVAPLPLRDEAQVLIGQVDCQIHLAAIHFEIRGRGPSKAGVAIMSSASIKLLAMPTTRSRRLTLGLVRTKSGGSSWVFSPGTSTNLRSPTMSMVTTYLLIDY